MFKLKKISFLVVLALVAIATSALAFDVAKLEQNMWAWATMETIIEENMTSTHNPVVSDDEALQVMEEARKEITKIVASIISKENLKEARALAKTFISMSGSEEKVGVALNKLLDKQENFIAAHKL